MRSPERHGFNNDKTTDHEGDAVSAAVLYMSMSVDGFIAGPNERPDNGLGDGGLRLHEWLMGGDLEALRRSGGVNGGLVDEFMATGAVVAGRGTFEPAGGWGGDHHDGVPIFIVARDEPGIDISQWPLVTYLDDVTAAMTRAKEAAGDRNVLVHGVGVTRLALAAGVLDELELHVVPVLFGQGRRLFEGLPAEQIELERTRTVEGEAGVIHVHYRVRR
jgi:dihydrofolate reductase